MTTTTRREVLVVALATPFAAAGCRRPNRQETAGVSPDAGRRNVTAEPRGPFSAHEVATVLAVARLIFPATDTDFGTDDVDVIGELQNGASLEAFEHLHSGVAWLDHQARSHGRSDFASAQEDIQTIILTVASSPVRTLHDETAAIGNRLFAIVREATFRAVYTDKRAWIALGFRGPPQPEGRPEPKCLPLR